jgi:HSP20 family protein
MAIARWSPISDLVSLHSAMDRLFDDSYSGGGRRRGDTFGVIGEGYLPLDVYRTEREWVIRAGIPNVDPGQVEVTCEGNTVRIAGEIKPPQEMKSENAWMRENFYGVFTREITLPEETVCEQSKAEFQNGMLVLTLPKAQPNKQQVKKIPVTAGANTSSNGGTNSGRSSGTSASSTSTSGQKDQPSLAAAGQNAGTGQSGTASQAAKDRERQTASRK